MKVEDVTETLNLALTASGCDSIQVEHRPRLLSDYGQCYIASDLGEWLEKRSSRRLELAAPFGGYKQSGNGRENGSFGIEGLLEIRGRLDIYQSRRPSQLRGFRSRQWQALPLSNRPSEQPRRNR
jgi:hypothetical protein